MKTLGPGLRRGDGSILLDDLRYNARTNGTATFADRKTQTFFHRNRCDQRGNHLHVVTRHHHLNAFRQLTGARHVRGTEVKLRTVALEERRVTTTLFLGQNVNLSFELGVRVDCCPGLART